MRGVVRRESRALSQEKAYEIIRETEHGVLATVDEQGRPATAALNHVLLEDGNLYFHTGTEGEKLDNIRANPQVSYFVTQTADVIYEQFTTAFSSAVVHGEMTVVEDEGERLRILTALVDRFSDGSLPAEVVTDFIAVGLATVAILRLTPTHITGKARLSRKRACLNYSVL
ncbi:MAG: pyridoxamine 5'-phosphate oxidase family protein [Coriobacteriales bacterium]|jgi:nitroimidazol reductase NimA-like FMN-containing flavoprotein (pyridoxamine 5'-phosphate oxidase superfamily)|nr:pyridoxamine 5'-phosphate oxidase family protein [Coriobacteriales bacterium]